MYFSVKGLLKNLMTFRRHAGLDPATFSKRNSKEEKDTGSCFTAIAMTARCDRKIVHVSHQFSIW